MNYNTGYQCVLFERVACFIGEIRPALDKKEEEKKNAKLKAEISSCLKPPPVS